MKLNKSFWFKLVPISFLGLNIFACGLAILVLSAKGVSSIDTTIIIIGDFLKLPYSGAVFVVQILFLILILIFNKKLYNYKELLLTTSLMFIFSSVVRMYEILLDKLNIQTTYITFVIGIILAIYGLAVVAHTNVFILPLDKFLNLISERLNKSYGVIKLATDIIFLIFAISTILVFDLGVPLTMWTFVFTFFVGPLITLAIKLNTKIVQSTQTKEYRINNS